MVFKEEMFREVLEAYKSHKRNGKIKEDYKDASTSADFHYLFSDYEDASKVFCRDKYKEKFSGSYYSEANFVKMTLTCEMMAIKLKLNEKFGEDAWRRFNSPPEVICFDILCLFWNPDLIDVNIKEPTTGKCEVDLILRDIQGRVILIIDVQGGGHEEAKEKIKDEDKVLHFEKHGIPYLPLKGTTIKDNYVGVLALFLSLFAELFKENGIVFLPEKRGVESLLGEFDVTEEHGETNNK